MINCNDSFQPAVRCSLNTVVYGLTPKSSIPINTLWNLYLKLCISVRSTLSFIRWKIDDIWSFTKKWILLTNLCFGCQQILFWKHNYIDFNKKLIKIKKKLRRMILGISISTIYRLHFVRISQVKCIDVNIISG